VKFIFKSHYVVCVLSNDIYFKGVALVGAKLEDCSKLKENQIYSQSGRRRKVNNNLKKSTKVIGEVFGLIMGREFTPPLEKEKLKYYYILQLH
jgi:hypothetical protein